MYDQAEFFDEIDSQRDDRALERIVQDRGHDTVVVIALYPSEDTDLLDDYGTWKHRLDDWRVDRQERILYGETIRREYRYITRSADRALERAMKRAAKDGFQLDENSDHTAEYFIERDGNYTTVEFDGYQIVARDLYVNHRFDADRDFRYFESTYTDSWDQEPPDADDIQAILADHHRLEEYCSDQWVPAYATITVYVRGVEVDIPESSVGDYESDNPDWLADALANLNLPALWAAEGV
jgi:hypothetical protein